MRLYLRIVWSGERARLSLSLAGSQTVPTFGGEGKRSGFASTYGERKRKKFQKKSVFVPTYRRRTKKNPKKNVASVPTYCTCEIACGVGERFGSSLRSGFRSGLRWGLRRTYVWGEGKGSSRLSPGRVSGRVSNRIYVWAKGEGASDCLQLGLGSHLGRVWLVSGGDGAWL